MDYVGKDGDKGVDGLNYGVVDKKIRFGLIYVFDLKRVEIKLKKRKRKKRK
ncbi:hypothetical protein [Staphylococcus saprophyticus]|uniref:hypothetical protein n=1 Tax=Staphylococcus saprophyticus TaxID=29385 RepID=UPI0016426E39|nr:hypothetical protein [Staphylococcus saprophyticus]